MAKQNKDEKPDVQSENVNEEDVFGSELDKDINAEKESAENNKTNDNSAKGPDSKDDIIRKLMLSIGYIVWILFFLPLVVYGNDPYAKRCANEQLNLFIFGAIGNLIFGVLVGIFALFLPVLSAIFGIVVSVWNFCLLIFGIVGIINVVSGNNKSLPIFGAFSIIK